jgi:gamma-glutamyl-gamma-aminobutyrate hydrolase PuuD
MKKGFSRVLVLSGVNCCEPFNNIGIETDYMSAERVVAGGLNLDHYDMVCFSGGTDVNPALYNQQRIVQTQHPDRSRDSAEIEVYNHAKRIGIPMSGICRGIQFLNVMNGGVLIQHCQGHGGTNHEVEVVSDLLRQPKGTTFITNSCHHQLCVPNEKAVVLAVCKDKVGKGHLSDKGSVAVDQEIEALYWPESRSVGVQWHHEWMVESSIGQIFFLDLLNLVA